MRCLTNGKNNMKTKKKDECVLHFDNNATGGLDATLDYLIDTTKDLEEQVELLEKGEDCYRKELKFVIECIINSQPYFVRRRILNAIEKDD